MTMATTAGAGTLALAMIGLGGMAPVRTGSDRCDDVSAERSAAISMEGARSVRVDAGAGSLNVTGRAGVRNVAAKGTACASSREILDRVQLTVRREGDVVLVKAEMPEMLRNREYASLDLVVDVPAGTPVEIDDGSGDLEVSGTGDTRIDDGSGEIRVHDLRGGLRIDDGSGDIHARTIPGPVGIDDGSGEIVLEGVGGDVVIEDGSGDIRVTSVIGTVHVSDGSGEIRVVGVERDVIVHDDGSGDIDVREVKGNLTVHDKGSGDVTYRSIGGRVDVPEDD